MIGGIAYVRSWNVPGIGVSYVDFCAEFLELADQPLDADVTCAASTASDLYFVRRPATSFGTETNDFLRS